MKLIAWISGGHFWKDFNSFCRIEKPEVNRNHRRFELDLVS